MIALTALLSVTINIIKHIPVERTCRYIYLISIHVVSDLSYEPIQPLVIETNLPTNQIG